MANMRIGKVASGAEYRMMEQFRLRIFGISIDFQITKILKISQFPELL